MSFIIMNRLFIKNYFNDHRKDKGQLTGLMIIARKKANFQLAALANDHTDGKKETDM